MTRSILRAVACLLLWPTVTPPTLAQEKAAGCEVGATVDRLPDLDYSCVRLSSGRKVLVVEAGRRSDPAVVLVHGLGNNAHRDWRYTYAELARQFHVVAFDLPGFGASESLSTGYSFAGLDAAIDQITTQRGVERFHLVGHSLGAAVSLYYADQHPQRIERLVLVDAAGVLLQQVFARQLIEANRAAAGGGALELLGVLAPGITPDRVLDFMEERLDVGALLASNPPLRRALFGIQIHADAALGLAEYDFTTAIRTVRSPTVILWGEHDTITPLRTGQLLAARMHDARLRIVPEAEHIPMIQRPEAFNRLLLAALTESLTAPVAEVVNTRSQGDVSCTNQANQRYTGTIDRLTLNDCSNVRIEDARIRELRAERSSLTLDRVIIEADTIALDVSDTTITATALTLVAPTAIRARASRLDLAGATLRASKRAVQLEGNSRLYFSVSDIDAPDYRGDAHFIWPPAK